MMDSKIDDFDCLVIEKEENLPPAKKLKQAKLSFLVSAESKTGFKANSQGQGKKRKCSVSGSPNKTAKISKPLVALCNAKSPNTNVTKLMKVSSKQEENDYEVSSSSEAEFVNVKSTGKCLMERFVLKIPQTCHQEITSTNDSIDLSMDLPPVMENISKELASCERKESTTKEKECKQSFVVLDRKECQHLLKQSTLETAEKVDESVTTGQVDESQSDRSVDVSRDQNSILKFLKVKSQMKENDNSQLDRSENVVMVDNNVVELGQSENNECERKLDAMFVAEGMPSVDSVDVIASENFPSSPSVITSTPVKNADVSESCTTPVNSSKIMLQTSSGKRKQKIGSAKRAEKEALRIKLKEEREKERLEKKRKLEEEKAEKERTKREKKEAKEKERQIQKEVLEKEKLEKLTVKENERKKKEEEKMKKEEERKKRQLALESKQEEKRKKEEERKMREEEKQREESEKKKKEEKTKLAFHSFFTKPKDTLSKSGIFKAGNGMFIPFELKKDMHLAPVVRRDALSKDKRCSLDQILSSSEGNELTYLEQLKTGAIKPVLTGRILRKNPQPSEDVVILHKSEDLKKVQHCVKLLQFHTDYRPPYYGTWKKQTSLSARNPWKKDESIFDYEVDSDEEWEEEEPGESLSCSDGEEEKGEDAEEDDEDGDGWMVPHGYLSEDEGCNEDDEITPEKLKLQQQAKAKAWEEGLKCKVQAVPMVTVGCFFEHSPSIFMNGDVRLLYDFRAIVLSTCTPIATGFSGCLEDEIISDSPVQAPFVKGAPKKSVPDDAMPDLIRLVHGNTCGIKRLIREFRTFWLKKNSPECSSTVVPPCSENALNDSLVDKEMDISVGETNVSEVDEEISEKQNDDREPQSIKKEEGHGCSISKRQLDLKIASMAVRERRAGFNKICWYVHQHILIQFNLSDITLPNTWVFLSSGPAKSSALNADKSLNISNAECTDSFSADKVEEDKTPNKSAVQDQKSIKDFAVSKEELTKHMLSQTSKPMTIPSTPTALQQTPKQKKNVARGSLMDLFAKQGGSSKKIRTNSSNMPTDDNSIKESDIEIIVENLPCVKHIPCQTMEAKSPVNQSSAEENNHLCEKIANPESEGSLNQFCPINPINRNEAAMELDSTNLAADKITPNKEGECIYID